MKKIFKSVISILLLLTIFNVSLIFSVMADSNIPEDFIGTYSNNLGSTMIVYPDRTTSADDNSSYPSIVGDMKKETDGSYSWSVSSGYDGYTVIIYPIGVDVISWDGKVVNTDTSQIRLWSGNGSVSTDQSNYIYYKQYVQNDIKVVLNGQELSFDQPPIMKDDRTLVPLRAIFEAMGYTVTWNESTQTAAAVNGSNKITVQVGSSVISYTTDGKSGTYTCDVEPQIVSDRILVPVRAIAESAGCSVSWVENTQTVIIVK